MDVQLPDGTTLQGVPEGTTKAQIAEKLKASGRGVPADWMAPKDTGTAPTSVSGAVRGALDVGIEMASGVLKQAVGVPKHLAQLAEKVTEPLSRMTPEQKAETAKKESEPGITEKLQELLSSHTPMSPEGKYLMGKLQGLLVPVSAVGEVVRAGSEKVVGKEATNVLSDVVGLAGMKSAGTASTAAKALKAAESTQSKVQRIVGNLSGGRSLEKADVGQVAQKAATGTLLEAKKAGTTAYDELTQAMGPGTSIPLTESTKAAQHYGAGLVVDPKVAAVSKTLQSVGSMTFDSLKTLRTQISDLMGSDRNVNRQLRGLRDAVTKDIEKAAEGLSPEARKKWDVANAKWKEYVKTEDEINRVMGKNWAAKTPAEMYEKLFRTARSDPQKVSTVMKAIKDPAVKQQFAASVLHHMADVGGEFNGDKFVRQWEGMNPQARTAMFSSVGSGYEQNMTRLVQNLKRIKEGHTGMVKELGGVGVAALLGHFIPGGTAVVGAVTVGREAYKFGPKAIEAYLTSPQWVRTLAERTTAFLERGAGTATVATQQLSPRTLNEQPGYGR